MENITNHLQQKAKKFSFHCLAVDENTDSTGTAQLLAFTTGIHDNLNEFEKLVGLQSMESRTTGKISCSEIVDCVTIKL